MAKKAITFQFEGSTIEALKNLAEKNGWKIQVTAEKAILKGLKTIK